MKRTRLLVAFSLVSALSGQSMATSPDGEQVWLASSWFLRDAVTEGRNFIFRRDASGSWSEVTHGAEFAAVFAPRPTADGSIIAWRRAFPCRFCVVPPPSEVRGLDKPLQIPLLFVSFSPNGRYALSAGAGGQSEYELEDRQTGVVYKASAGNAPTLLLPGDDAAVTNNGTLVGRAPNGALIRWRPGTAGVTLVPDASNAVSWGASDDGRRVWLRSPEQGTLRSVDTATGASVVLAASDAFIIRMSGWPYLVTAAALGAGFMRHAWKLHREGRLAEADPGARLVPAFGRIGLVPEVHGLDAAEPIRPVALPGVDTQHLELGQVFLDRIIDVEQAVVLQHQNDRAEDRFAHRCDPKDIVGRHVASRIIDGVAARIVLDVSGRHPAIRAQLGATE